MGTMLIIACQKNYKSAIDQSNTNDWQTAHNAVKQYPGIAGEMALGVFQDRYYLFTAPIKNPIAKGGYAYDAVNKQVLGWRYNQGFYYLTDGNLKEADMKIEQINKNRE